MPGMALDLIPRKLRRKYRFDERDHAAAILAVNFPEEFRDLMECLDWFWLKRSMISEKGGNRSAVSRSIDGFLGERGWAAKAFDTRFLVDGREIPSPTHEIDNFKNRVAVEVEWNSKDTSFDRDLNNFRLLRQLKVLSVGVIITRLTELQQEFKKVGKARSTGQSTTHWDKLIPKVDGGGAGGCPLLLVGLGFKCYRPDE
jgi:hypothetical protein